MGKGEATHLHGALAGAKLS